MAENQAQEIRNQQRASWNKFSSGWKKWDDLTMRMLKPTADVMLASADLRGQEWVLDVASGTGEPGLTAAALVPKGKVLATDLAEDMIAVARENAHARGLKNFETKVCSADAIDAPDASFDVVLCRYGFMFFPDLPAAARELRRVLKPGGRLIAAVWSGPEKNPWATTVMGAINQLVEMPTPAPDAPGLFRCAKPGLLSEVFSSTGYKGFSSKEIQWEADFGPIQDYWTFMTEVPAPVVAGMAKADSATRDKIHEKVIAAATPNIRDGKLYLGCGTHVIIATA